MAAVTHSVVARLKALLAGKRSVDLADTPVYMLGFHVYRPPAEWRIAEEDLEPLNAEFHRALDAKTSEFFNKILARAGLTARGPTSRRASWRTCARGGLTRRTCGLRGRRPRMRCSAACRTRWTRRACSRATSGCWSSTARSST